MTVKEALEKRAECVVALREHRDSMDGTPAWQEKWDQINADVDKYGKVCDVEARMQDVDKQLAEQSARADDLHRFAIRHGEADPRERRATVGDIDVAIQGWTMQHRGRNATLEHRSAAERIGIDLTDQEIDIPMAEFRNLTIAGEGAETIPAGFRASLEKELQAVGSARVYSKAFNTSTGNSVAMPIVTDVANDGAILAEEFTIGSSVDPNFETVTSTVVKYSSTPILVSSELMQDSAFNLGSELGTMLGGRIRRGQNPHFTTGSGSGQPQGHITGSLLGSDPQGTVQSAGTTAITYEDIVNLIHGVDPEWRPGASFVCHDSTIGVLRKIRSASGGSGMSGEPMWQESMRAGEPSTLFGYPVFVNQNMDDATILSADEEPLSFGAHGSKFLIRDAGSIRLRILNELYAGTDQVGFVAFLRSDSRCLWSSNWTNYPVKVLQQS